jgi:TRAP-type C4-dicarboxylate transport system permease large subunit
MRSDYIMYIIAVICFIIAGYTVTQSGETIQLSSYAIAVVGIVFVGLGYLARPKNTVFSKVTPVSTQSKPTKLSSKEEETLKAETEKKTAKQTPKKRATRKTTTKKKTRRRKKKE